MRANYFPRAYAAATFAAPTVSFDSFFDGTISGLCLRMHQTMVST